jgi:iron complex outermembrane recepter protein
MKENRLIYFKSITFANPNFLKPKIMRVKLSCLFLFLFSVTFAQTTITGKVIDSLGNSVAGAKIKNAKILKGIYTDFIGEFVLENVTLPVSINISSYGYKSVEVNIVDSSPLIITLKNEVTSLSEIVVSASRTKEKLIESPVTIERMSRKDLINTSSSNFYNGLENVKEINMNSGSLIHKSINTRGFATAANPRFMQLVDGMENTPPGLNVVVGNLVGFSKLDIETIEILPGASSALYGANAFNGILFMNSRSPFTSHGISAYYEQGYTSQKVAGTNPFYDFGVRGAYKFSDKFAVKGNITYFTATDWQAADDRNIALIGQSLPKVQFYDGLNLYGDESFRTVATAPGSAFLVSRTPYTEQDLNDGKVNNFKIDASVNWRPKTDNKDFEIILQHKMGTGSSNYSASDARTYLKNFLLRQSKLEVKGKNFFFRNYLTAEDSGDTYSVTRAAIALNEASKSSNVWYTDYTNAYIASTNTGDARFIEARNAADNKRLSPGTQQYKDTFNAIVNDTGANGAKIDDKTNFFHSEGNYNFRDMVKFADIQVGGSFRNYNLNSKGTVFSDRDSPISFNEYGIYSQIQNKFINERLKLTGSVRYDKSQNFQGDFSPRFSMSFAFGKNLQRNLRASFQTGFRNPTTTDQYYGLNIGPIAFVGSAANNLDRYKEDVINTLTSTAVPLTGNDAYGSTYTLTSVQNYVAGVLSGAPSAANISILKASSNTLVKPERVKSYELGYRADISKFIFDFNFYYNDYQDFIYSKKVVKPLFGDLNNPNPGSIPNPNSITTNATYAILTRNTKTFQIYTNSNSKVNSLGFGIGLEKRLSNFDLSINFNHAEIKYDKNIDPDFQPAFNTPKNRIKFGLGNENLFKNFGFQTNVRWSSSYLWQSTLANGIIPEVTVIDAQVNYKITSLKSTIKVGANNLFGQDYLNVLGAGLIGQQYFISLVINQ